MPLEELLAAYGYVRNGASTPADAAAADAAAPDTGVPEPEASGAAAAMDVDAAMPSQPAAKQAAAVKHKPDEPQPAASGGSGADSPREWAQLLAEADDAATLAAPAVKSDGQAPEGTASDATAQQPAATSPSAPPAAKRVTRQAAAAAEAAAASPASGAGGKPQAASSKCGAAKGEKQASDGAAEDDLQHGSLEDAARAAIAAQPTGFTLSTTNVQTKVRLDPCPSF